MAPDMAESIYSECPITLTEPFTIVGIQGIPVIDCRGKDDAFRIAFQEKSKSKKKETNRVMAISNLKIRNAKTAIFDGMSDNITSIRLSNVTFEGNDVDVSMKNPGRCFLWMKSVAGSGLSGGGIQFDSCGDVKVTLIESKFYGKYFKVVSTSRTVALTMKNVIFDMRRGLNSSKAHALVYIQTARVKTNIAIHSSQFLNCAGKTNGSVVIESPRKLIRKKGKPPPNPLIVVLFEKVTFMNNSATAGNGGAFSFKTAMSTNRSKHAQVSFRSCTFRENSAFSEGGALWFGKRKAKTIQFTECEFIDNRAYGPGVGKGGALLVSGGKLLINNCRFYGNSASKIGGTLHLVDGSNAKITDSDFQNNRNSRNSIMGDVMYVYNNNMELDGKVTFDLQSANFQKSIFWFVSKQNVLKMSNSTRFICPTGYNYQELDDTKYIRDHKQMYHIFGFICGPCQDLFYSVSRGYHQANGSGFRGKCHECPHGASCNGTIRARANFWGLIRGDTITMVHCPRGYCCDREPCPSYNSCRSHRTGTLCGRCEKGFSEGISSSVCHPNELCTSEYVAILIVSVILILVFFLCQQELIAKLAVCLLWNVEKNEQEYRQEARRQDDEELYHADTPLFSENHPISSPENHRNPTPDYTRIEESQSFNNAGGYIKVFFYFYQVMILLRVSRYVTRSSFPNRFLEVLIPFLNFQFADAFSTDCIFKNLTPVNKVLFKSSVCYWVLSAALFSYFVYKFVRYVKFRSSEPIDNIPAFRSRSFPLRLTGAVIQIILLSYVALTHLTVTLLHCVEVGGQHVLQIDGSVVCYQPFQGFFWLFLCVCIVPFPLVLIFGRKLLISGHLSPRLFIVACFFPLIFLLYWAYLYRREFRGQTVEGGRDPFKDKILYILQHPYKTAESPDTRTWSESMMENWESVLMFRRLVLVLAFIFFTSFLWRAYLLCLLSFCILLHHVSIQPFVNKKVNQLETASLTLIALFSTFNIGEASFGAAGKVSPPLVETIQALQDWFLTLLPFIIVAVLLAPRAIYYFLSLRLCYRKQSSSFQSLRETEI